jgi:hypothetical protein
MLQLGLEGAALFGDGDAVEGDFDAALQTPKSVGAEFQLRGSRVVW